MVCFLYELQKKGFINKKENIFFMLTFFVVIKLGLSDVFFSNITNTLKTDLLFFIDDIKVERLEFSKANPKMVIFENVW